LLTGKHAGRGAFLLCKTSNPGSNELLALNLSSGETLYERIAHLVGSDWSNNSGSSSSQNNTDGGNNNNGGSCCCLGLVVGATDPEALEKARLSAGEATWILAPGVGAQGGNLLEAAKAGLNASGSRMLIPVSRGISRAQDPGAAAKELREKIQAVREQIIQQKQEEESSSVNKKGRGGLLKPYQREFLEFSVAQKVLRFGSFVLKSGRTSPYFFNAGLFASGAALHKLGKAYASTIMGSSDL